MVKSKSFALLYKSVSTIIEKYITQNRGKIFKIIGVNRATELLERLQRINVCYTDAVLLYKQYKNDFTLINPVETDLHQVTKLLELIERFDFGSSSVLVNAILDDLFSMHNLVDIVAGDIAKLPKRIVKTSNPHYHAHVFIHHGETVIDDAGTVIDVPPENEEVLKVKFAHLAELCKFYKNRANSTISKCAHRLHA